MEYFDNPHPVTLQSAPSTFAINEPLWTDVIETTLLRKETTCTGLSEMHWNLYHQLSYWLEGVGILIVGSLGILLNTASVCILLTKELVDSHFNNLVVSLAIVDNMFLLSSVLYHVPGAFELDIEHTYIYRRILSSFLYPTIHTTLYCSTYMTVILALDRYNSVSQPSKYKSATRRINQAIYVLQYTLPVILFSAVFNIPKYFDLKIKELVEVKMSNFNMSTSNTSFTYALAKTDLRMNQTYVFWYVNVANFVVTCFIPLVCLIYLNGNMYRLRKKFLERQRKRRKSSVAFNDARKRQNIISAKSNTQQAIILHSIVIVFVICHSLRIVLNIEEWINIKASERGCYRFWTMLAKPVAHLLLQINSSANFVIYFVLNKTFTNVLRQKLISMFRCCRQKLDDIPADTKEMYQLTAS